MRGYPLACSTPARRGHAGDDRHRRAARDARGDPAAHPLRASRRAACSAARSDECRRSQTTIRKAGVSTGCRSCPNDGAVRAADAWWSGSASTEIDYPIDYRGLDAEHDDPFYDRDYNLCILCGRCVRMCQEVRGASVLAFKYRGPATRDRAGLRRVARRGRLRVLRRLRVRLPDRRAGRQGLQVGRQARRRRDLDVPVLRPRLPGRAGAQGRPPLAVQRAPTTREINDGQLCVRGPVLPAGDDPSLRRARRKPMLRKGEYFREVAWDEALDEVAGELAGVAPGRVPDARLAPTSPTRACSRPSGSSRTAWARTASTRRRATRCRAARRCGRACSRCRSRSRPLARGRAVIVAGLDTRFSFSVVGRAGAPRRAARRHARRRRRARVEPGPLADEWLRPRARRRRRARSLAPARARATRLRRRASTAAAARWRPSIGSGRGSSPSSSGRESRLLGADARASSRLAATRA